jgi:uncharacterized protein YjiS (DUF1127 family)
MAHIVTPAALGNRSAFSTLKAKLAERLARYRVYRQTLAELGHLSERELADLGIHRSQITSIATEAAYGK